jgi:hypothetical protein
VAAGLPPGIYAHRHAAAVHAAAGALGLAHLRDVYGKSFSERHSTVCITSHYAHSMLQPAPLLPQSITCLPTCAPASPQLLTLKVTGDVLRVTTRIGAPVLPGFGPSPAAQNAAASEAARRGGGAAARRRQLSQAAVDYLMPAQAPNPDIASQVGPGG